MANPAGESNGEVLWLDFDRRLMVQFADRWSPPTPACSRTGNSTMRFLALGAPMSPAWVHGSPRVEELALPKSVESGNLSINKAVILDVALSIRSPSAFRLDGDVSAKTVTGNKYPLLMPLESVPTQIARAP